MPTLKHIQTRRQNTLDSMLNLGPEHFDMAAWFTRPATSNDEWFTVEGDDKVWIELDDITGSPKSCGTTACIAGHAVGANRSLREALRDGGGDEYDQQKVANYLGLDGGQMYNGSDLFYEDAWPLWMNTMKNRFAKGKKAFGVAVTVLSWLTVHPEVSQLPDEKPKDMRLVRP